MAKTKTVLGRGLEALIANVATTTDRHNDTLRNDDGRAVGTICAIELTKVRPNPFQPRIDFNKEALDELKRSILSNGVIQPITVRRVGREFELISGERRVRASMDAGLETIPAYVLDVDSDRVMLEMALIENVQRENLNPIEVALGYQRLIKECNLRQEELAQKVGKDRSTVTNFLRLLRLPTRIQESLRDNGISMGHARALLALSDDNHMMTVWKQVLDDGLSVRRTETLIRELGERARKPGPHLVEENGAKKIPAKATKTDLDATLDDISLRLQQVFGTHVRIKSSATGQGQMIVDFYSSEDLERLLEMFAIIERHTP